jgi:hypothetical protein
MLVGVYAQSTIPQTTVVKAKFMFFTVSGCRVMRSRGIVVSWYGGVRGGDHQKLGYLNPNRLRTPRLLS